MSVQSSVLVHHLLNSTKPIYPQHMPTKGPTPQPLIGQIYVRVQAGEKLQLDAEDLGKVREILETYPSEQAKKLKMLLASNPVTIPKPKRIKVHTTEVKAGSPPKTKFKAPESLCGRGKFPLPPERQIGAFAEMPIEMIEIILDYSVSKRHPLALIKKIIQADALKGGKLLIHALNSHYVAFTNLKELEYQALNAQPNLNALVVPFAAKETLNFFRKLNSEPSRKRFLEWIRALGEEGYVLSDPKYQLNKHEIETLAQNIEHIKILPMPANCIEQILFLVKKRDPNLWQRKVVEFEKPDFARHESLAKEKKL